MESQPTDAGDETLHGTHGVTPELDTPELERGTMVGRYVVLSRLGAGAMGVVYAAYDPDLDRKIALKFLIGSASRSARGQERLFREAQAMAKLSHPNVIAVHDVGEHGGRVFLAMDFFEGDTLRTWCAKKSRSWREIVDVHLRAARGLAAAHAKGLVHRDFKPDNVMVADDGRVCVMDFGLAVGIERDSGGDHEGGVHAEIVHTAADRRLVGTPAYMAAEQLLGRDVGPAVDQFAFCATLWEALYGQRPFAAKELAALVLATTSGEIDDPPPGTRVPFALRRILERGLASDPARRFPTMDALIAVLSRDPTRRGRITLGIATIAALVGVGFGARALTQQARVHTCRSEAAALAQRWTEHDATSIGQAFDAADLSYARATWDHTAPILSAWVDDWSTARAAWCIAANVEKSLDPEIAQIGRECMDDARARFEAVLEQLRAPDDLVVQRAALAGVGLPRVDSCTDDRTLRSRPRPPAGVTAADVASVRHELSIATAAVDLGHADRSHMHASAALSKAQALGWAPLVAEARLAVAVAAEELGDFAQAEREGEAAFVEAMSVAHDELAMLATVKLIFLTGNHLARPTDGLRWYQIGRGLAARLGVPDDDLRMARLYGSAGTLYRMLQQWDEARTALARAVEISEAMLGPDHIHVAVAINNLGNLHQELGQYDESLRLHERGLAINERVYGPSHPAIATALLTLSSSHMQLGHASQALALSERALALVDTSSGARHPILGQALYQAGEVLSAMDRDADAQLSYERAIAVWEATLGPDHANLGYAHNNLATVHHRAGRLEIAQKHYEQAVAIWQKTLRADHADLGALLGNLGAIYFQHDDYDRALEYLGRSIAALEGKLGPEHPTVGSMLFTFAMVHVHQEHWTPALAALERAFAIHQKQPVSHDRAAIQLGLVQALWDSGVDRARARRLAEQGLIDLADNPGAASQVEHLREWLVTHG